MAARMTLAPAVLALALLACAALAEEAVPSLAGEVRVSSDGQPSRPMRDGEALPSGSTVTTGAASRVILRFPDGQRVVLGMQTELRIVDYRYAEAQPLADRAVFDLAKGVARFVTGIIGQRSRDVIAVRTPQATIGMRGADFLVAVMSAAYLQVLRGAVDVESDAGTLLFEPGTFGSVVGNRRLALVIPAEALPSAVAQSFRQLAAIPAAELALVSDNAP